MRRHRLFCADLEKGPVVLSPEESHHAIVSLRVRPGEEVVLFDGAGREAVAVIRPQGPSAKRSHRLPRLQADVRSIEHKPFELSRQITLAVAMPKPQRQGYLIEKCTELGVAAIWPIIAERSVAVPTDSAVEKWTRRAIEAAKQSGRVWLPQVARPRTFAEGIERIGEFAACGVASPGDGCCTLLSFLGAKPHGAKVMFWVGPEGGWTQAELELALRSGAVPINLGPTVLRTETAAAVVCAAAAMCSVESCSREG